MDQFTLVCKPTIGLNNILRPAICRPAIVRCPPQKVCMVQFIEAPPLNEPISVANLCEPVEFQENQVFPLNDQGESELNYHKENLEDHYELP